MSLSVVVTSCNRPSSLQRAVESALEQAPVEQVVIVDDASDQPPDLSGLDTRRVRMERHPVNRGACAARNTGLSMVRTDHIAFLDDDDRLLSDAYPPLLDALNDSCKIAVGTVVV